MSDDVKACEEAQSLALEAFRKAEEAEAQARGALLQAKQAVNVASEAVYQASVDLRNARIRARQGLLLEQAHTEGVLVVGSDGNPIEGLWLVDVQNGPGEIAFSFAANSEGGKLFEDYSERYQRVHHWRAPFVIARTGAGASKIDVRCGKSHHLRHLGMIAIPGGTGISQRLTLKAWSEKKAEIRAKKAGEQA